jgi:hypothetical protein
MSSPIPAKSIREAARLGNSSDDSVGSLDVGWLLHSKKGE